VSPSNQVDSVFESIYTQLRDMAAVISRQEAHAAVQPTSLVHEAWLKMMGGVDCESQVHFKSIAARAMRQVLRDRVRRQGAQKRGGGWRQVTLAKLGSEPRLVDEIALSDALDELEQLKPRLGKVVELRLLGGLTHRETAELLGISERSAERDWRLARAWLIRRLDP